MRTFPTYLRQILEVKFRSKQLELCFAEFKAARKTWGDEVARKYILRINTLKHARDVDEISKLPGLRFHRLKGQRTGEYAIMLTGFYRLIVTLEGEHASVVRIEEVSKHYDD